MESIPKHEDKKVSSDLESWEVFLDTLMERQNDSTTTQEHSWIPEINEISPFFKALCDRVALENPDRVIFLDGGARVFAIPYIKYMRQRHSISARADFIDDDILRAKELQFDISDTDGKKFFFIDDVLFKGRNAEALEELAQKYNFSYQYFSLSTHPSRKHLAEQNDLETVTANPYSGQYVRGALYASTTNALYFEHARDKTELRAQVHKYQDTLLEKMLSL